MSRTYFLIFLLPIEVNIARITLKEKLDKGFDCAPPNLLIAKLNTYGFDRRSPVFFYSHLKRRKHCVNVNNIQNIFQTLLSGVPQGLILGPLPCNIFINDLITFIKSLHYTILQMITQ